MIKNVGGNRSVINTGIMDNLIAALKELTGGTRVYSVATTTTLTSAYRITIVTASGYTMTFATAGGMTSGAEYIIINATEGVTTIAPASGESMLGVVNGTITLSGKYSYVSLISDGVSAWQRADGSGDNSFIGQRI
jgi:hypothetical protein